jgi:hypothetical protein
MSSQFAIQPNDAQLPSGRTTGIVIGTGSILTVVFMAYHPTIHVHAADDFIAEINRVAFVNRIVHGVLIALVGVLVCGFSCLASRLGSSSGIVRAGLVAYIMGAIAMTTAATINGFVLADFVSVYESRSKESVQIMTHVVAYGSVANRICSSMGVLGMSSAVALWSISLIGRPGALRVIGLLGCVAGTGPVLAMLAGYLQMDVHGMLAFVLVQTLWSLAIAAQLIRGRI